MMTFSGTGGPLVDYDSGTATPGQAVFTINIGAAGTLNAGLGNILVRLIGFQHSFAGDLTVTLTHVPSGISRTLFDSIVASSDFGDNYSFGSTFTGDLVTVALGLGDVDTIPGETPIPPTLYYPTSGSNVLNDLSAAFAGVNMAGAWTLTITDNVADDVGDLQSWELTLDIDTAVPEPGTWLLAGPGIVLVALRKRFIRS